jgi:hypothetical protein
MSNVTSNEQIIQFSHIENMTKFRLGIAEIRAQTAQTCGLLMTSTTADACP